MRLDRVIPFRQNAMWHDIDLRFLLRCDFSSSFIDTLIQASLTPQARLGFSRPNELEDGLIADQRFAFPVTANEREKPVLNRIPFGGTGGQVGDGDGQVKFVSQLLQPPLPEPAPMTIATSAIGFDQQLAVFGLSAVLLARPGRRGWRVVSGMFGLQPETIAGLVARLLEIGPKRG